MTATKRPASGRSGASGSSKGRKPAARRAPARPPATPLVTRIWRTVGAATDGHRGDLAGLVVVALGVVCGLGVYANAAGPFGRVAASGAGSLVGAARVFVPPVLVLVGILVIRGAKAPLDDAAADAAAGSNTRITLGATLGTLGGLGLLHLARGAPTFADGLAAQRDAAGLVGGAVGQPLRALLATGGAAVVLVLAVLGSLVLITRTSLRTAAGATASAAGATASVAATHVGPATRALRRAVGSLFRLGGTERTDGGADPAIDLTGEHPVITIGGEAPALYDQDTDGAAKPKRSRKPKAVPEDEPVGEPVAPTQLEIALGPAGQPSAWKLPPAKLLGRTGTHAVDTAAIEETGHGLEHALAEHGVETRLIGMTVGPTVTRYELELGPGVKVARVTSLHKDIAYAMATPDVRILAPIPGKQAIGVEIPNARKQLVTVGDILASAEARQATHPLEVAVGRDIAGTSILANLATMPHVLIAGATGAGKSSCINSLITSILMRSTPDQVRMILVDPKRVEMGQYNRLPHLLTEVVTNPKKAANALAWAVREMERRYDLLSEAGFRDVNGYNAAYDRGDLDPEKTGVDGVPGPDYVRLPFILIVVDELNDLMMVAARDVEESITRIAQMARAVGIHLVVATQRPSVNVITGVIKANIPARWAFAVSSLADSRVILDQPGAERLLGRGDLLLLGPASSIAQRVQGCWVTEDEVRAVVAHWKRQAPELAYDEKVQGADEAPGTGGHSGSGSGGADDDDEELVRQAMELIVRSQLGSTSMLQRKLRVGFARAGRLMDLLEQRGVVGPSEGSKARAVLMTVDELDDAGGRPGGGTEPAGGPGDLDDGLPTP